MIMFCFQIWYECIQAVFEMNRAAREYTVYYIQEEF